MDILWISFLLCSAVMPMCLMDNGESHRSALNQDTVLVISIVASTVFVAILSTIVIMCAACKKKKTHKIHEDADIEADSGTGNAMDQARFSMKNEESHEPDSNSTEKGKPDKNELTSIRKAEDDTQSTNPGVVNGNISDGSKIKDASNSVQHKDEKGNAPSSCNSKERTMPVDTVQIQKTENAVPDSASEETKIAKSATAGTHEEHPKGNPGSSHQNNPENKTKTETKDMSAVLLSNPTYDSAIANCDQPKGMEHTKAQTNGTGKSLEQSAKVPREEYEYVDTDNEPETKSCTDAQYEKEKMPSVVINKDTNHACNDQVEEDDPYYQSYAESDQSEVQKENPTIQDKSTTENSSKNAAVKSLSPPQEDSQKGRPSYREEDIYEEVDQEESETNSTSGNSDKEPKTVSSQTVQKEIPTTQEKNTTENPSKNAGAIGTEKVRVPPEEAKSLSPPQEDSKKGRPSYREDDIYEEVDQEETESHSTSSNTDIKEAEKVPLQKDDPSFEGIYESDYDYIIGDRPEGAEQGDKMIQKQLSEDTEDLGIFESDYDTIEVGQTPKTNSTTIEQIDDDGDYACCGDVGNRVPPDINPGTEASVGVTTESVSTETENTELSTKRLSELYAVPDKSKKKKKNVVATEGNPEPQPGEDALAELYAVPDKSRRKSTDKDAEIDGNDVSPSDSKSMQDTTDIAPSEDNNSETPTKEDNRKSGTPFSDRSQSVNESEGQLPLDAQDIMPEKNKEPSSKESSDKSSNNGPVPEIPNTDKTVLMDNIKTNSLLDKDNTLLSIL